MPDVAMCAHLKVSWRTRTIGGLTSGWWACDDCDSGFVTQRSVDYMPPNTAERRRYALLQAATEFYWRGIEQGVDDWTPRAALHDTLGLLAEIERQEKEAVL